MTEPTDNRPIIHITNDVDFLTSLPAMVGIVPANDLVAVAFTETAEMICTLRIGSRAHPDNIDQMLAVIDDQAHSMIAVIVEEDFEVAGNLGKYVVARLGDKVRSVYAMPVMAPGAHWVELSSGTQGEMGDYATSDLAMVNAVEGKPLYNNPEEITEQYALDDPAYPPLEFESPHEFIDAMNEVGQAILNRTTCHPATVGGILVFSEGARDEVLNFIEVDSMDAHTVFAHAAQHLRGPARIEALTVAAVAAYLSGEGLLAAAAMDAAFISAAESWPYYEPTLALAVSKAYHQGLHPAELRKLVIKSEVRKIRDNQ